MSVAGPVYLNVSVEGPYVPVPKCECSKAFVPKCECSKACVPKCGCTGPVPGRTEGSATTMCWTPWTGTQLRPSATQPMGDI